MSLIRSLLSLVLAFLFVTFLFSAITSYTIGNLLVKENLKEFVKTDIGPQLLAEQCGWLCQAETNKEACVNVCLTEALRQSEQSFNDMIDELYSKQVFGITLEQISVFMNQTQLFSFLALVCLFLLGKISEEPLNMIAKGLMTAGISLTVAGLSPNMIVGTTIVGVPVLGNMFSYLSQGLELQAKIGIGLFILGVVLLIIENLTKKE